MGIALKELPPGPLPTVYDLLSRASYEFSVLLGKLEDGEREKLLNRFRITLDDLEIASSRCSEPERTKISYAVSDYRTWLQRLSVRRVS